MVCKETYYRKVGSKDRVFFSEEVETEFDEKGAVFKAYLKKDKQPVIIGSIEKMSKSKKNGVDPEGLIKNYGADTVRLYTMRLQHRQNKCLNGLIMQWRVHLGFSGTSGNLLYRLLGLKN